MLEPLEINGEPPSLAGLVCDELLVQECWYSGELVEPVNVVYLRFAGAWHRLYFDCGIVFWRSHDDVPESVPPSEHDFACPLVDLGQQLGIRGMVLERMEAAPVVGGSEVRLAFRNGVVVVFSNVADTSTYRVAQGGPIDRCGM